jgi:hypothetical protein
MFFKNSFFLFGLVVLLQPFSLVGQQSLQSNLPIIVIDTDDWLIFDEPKFPATLYLAHRKDGSFNEVRDTATALRLPIGIELRGKTSQLLSRSWTEK